MPAETHTDTHTHQRIFGPVQGRPNPRSITPCSRSKVALSQPIKEKKLYIYYNTMPNNTVQ